ncbi:MAG TPA: four helix bundle protein [Patescibacteria group bacterium]|nr:four helix bundle protein [Patescibacteria group bacterium]
MIRDVTDLEVYKEALKLLPELYKIVNNLPLSERYLELQAKRAAKSVSANIAEGFAKRSSAKEFRRYLLIALASNDEVITHLRTLAITFPKAKNEASALQEKYKVLSKRINTLHKNWRFGGSL